jgi:hypothetical protein
MTRLRRRIAFISSAIADVFYAVALALSLPPRE